MDNIKEQKDVEAFIRSARGITGAIGLNDYLAVLLEVKEAEDIIYVDGKLEYMWTEDDGDVPHFYFSLETGQPHSRDDYRAIAKVFNLKVVQKSINEIVKEFKQKFPNISKTYPFINNWIYSVLYNERQSCEDGFAQTIQAERQKREEMVEALQSIPYGTNRNGEKWIMKKDLDEAITEPTNTKKKLSSASGMLDFPNADLTQ